MSQYQHGEGEGADGSGRCTCLALFVREIQDGLCLRRVMAVIPPRALGTTFVSATVAPSVRFQHVPLERNIILVRHSGGKAGRLKYHALIDLDLVPARCCATR